METYYVLKSRTSGMVKAISKHSSLKDFAKGEWKCERVEGWPFKDAKEEKETPSAAKKAEPTIKPKYRTSRCAYLMYV